MRSFFPFLYGSQLIATLIPHPIHSHVLYVRPPGIFVGGEQKQAVASNDIKSNARGWMETSLPCHSKANTFTALYVAENTRDKVVVSKCEEKLIRTRHQLVKLTLPLLLLLSLTVSFFCEKHSVWKWTWKSLNKTSKASFNLGTFLKHALKKVPQVLAKKKYEN